MWPNHLVLLFVWQVCPIWPAQRWRQLQSIDVLALPYNATAYADIKIAPFLTGVAAAYVVQSGLTNRFCIRYTWPTGLIALVTLLVVLPYFCHDNIPAVQSYYFVGFAVVVLFTWRGLLPFQRVLTIKPLRMVGVAGYGLYLWHWPITCALWYLGINNHFLLFVAVCGVTPLVALTTYRLIEQPFMRIDPRTIMTARLTQRSGSQAQP